MKNVHEVVKKAALRMGLDRANRLSARCLIVVAGVTCAGILAHRLFYLGRPVAYGVLATAGAAVAAAVVLTVRGWPGAIAAAIEVDRRTGLAERISTALAVEGRQDPMARAVLEDARRYAARVSVAEAFPLRWHREYWGALGLGLLALALFVWMPQYDLLSRRARQEELAREQAAVRREARRMRRELNRLKRLAAPQSLEKAEAYLERTEEVIRRMERGKMTRAEALAELNRLAEVLKEARRGLSPGSLVPKSMLSKRGLTRKLARALAQRDFQAARRELSQLAQQASTLAQRSTQDSEDLKRRLQELLEKLKEANQKDLAERLEQLRQQAQSEKLTPEQLDRLKEELAELAQELQKRNLTALSDELQRLLNQVARCQQCLGALAQLQQELSALARSLSECPGLASALSSLALALSEGDMEALQAALKEGLLEFDSLEDVEARLAFLEACQSLCTGGKRGLAKNLLATWGGTGIYTPWDTRKIGPGMGSGGIGIGGKAAQEPQEVGFQPTRIKGRVRPGRVAGSFFIDGVQIKGEARVEFQETVQTAAQEAAEAVEKEQIPRLYREYVRRYFQDLAGE